MKAEHKKQLQAEIIWAATRTGAFQRSRIYDNADDGQKEQFRVDMYYRTKWQYRTIASKFQLHFNSITMEAY